LSQSERLYYADSFLKRFTATVTGTRQRESSNGEAIWQLSLNHTAFYPTSGGQPFDVGVLHVTSPDGAALGIPVEEVAEDDEGTVWHFVRQPLEPGMQVEGHIDWERRFDHMQQHTGQHLLSAVSLREAQATTVSFHLGQSVSTIDLAVASPERLSLERVERIANEIIAEDRPVTTSYVSREDAEAMLSAGGLRKLPDREGAIRLIDIANCDRNACGGTHVRSTGQIGGLLVRATEKVSRGLRVEFVCGLRAIRAAGRDAAILGEVTGLLSTGVPELPTAVKRLLADAKAGTREKEKLCRELAEFQAAQLIAEEPVANGMRLLVREWKDRDRDFIKLLASRTASGAGSTAVIFCAKDADPARVVIARSPDLNFHCGTLLREVLSHFGLRGGGSPDLAQGDAPREHEQAILASIVDTIRSAVAAAAGHDLTH
jgi:alanyl-tRNA synthetase